MQIRRYLALGTRWRRLKAAALFRKYRSSTLILPRDFIANLALIERHLAIHPTPGAVLECGTWRGGMSAALIETCGKAREYHFFDSFEGLPSPTEIDGTLAFAVKKEFERDHNNCSASVEEFTKTINRAGSKINVHIHKGFFADVFPQLTSIPEIAVLRIDADWHDSVRLCLAKFWDHVVPNGLVIIDDYYLFDGCSRAVHEFLAGRSSSARIQQVETQAYIIKPAE